MLPTVITLSSIPSRFSLLQPTLRSLLAQALPAKAIHLYIPKRYRRFPRWDGRLPAVPEGISIKRCETDMGPATKILPACQEFAGQDIDLLFCDDDKIYDRQWHARLKHAQAEHPNCCIVGAGENLPDIADSSRPADQLPRARRWTKNPLSYRIKRILSLFTIKAPTYASSGFVDILSGQGGALVRPDWFGPEAWNIPHVLWTVDDPWLSGQLARQGIPIWLVAKARRMASTEAGKVDALLDLVEKQHGRVRADVAAIDHIRKTYGIWQPAGPTEPLQPWMTDTMRFIAKRALSHK